MTSVALHRRAERMPIATIIAAAVVLAYAFAALFAPLIAPYGQTQIAGDVLEPWSARHLLGTDGLGRDVFSRLLFAVRNTGSLAFVANLIAFAIGSTAGVMAASVGGWVDNVMARIVDAIMALPQLILALLLLSIFGSSIGILIAIIVVLDAARIFRLSRAVAMNIVVLPYAELARVRGEGLWWIMRREIWPNITTPLLAELGIRFCYVFLFISGLSFLGLGIQPPAADLGSMVRESSVMISFGDFTPLVPAATIAALTVSVNLLIDRLIHRSSGLD